MRARSATSGRAPSRAARGGKLRRRRRRRILLAVAGTLILAFVAFVGILYAFARIPEPADIATAQSVQVVDREGRPLGRIHAEADRVSIPLEEVPEHVRQAVIAVEDRDFYRHPGVSVTSIFRAAFTNLVGGGIRQGGSTITQQYVKNAFVGNERSIWRKTREAVLALKLERQRSKDEILELYLNTIYLGRGAYGVEAATRTYFGKRARGLTLAEGALLAGMIRAPESYEPSRDRRAARARRDVVLRLMVEQGYVTEARAARAARSPLRVRPRTAGGLAPHALEDIRRDLERRVGARTLYAGDVRVVSTIDLDAQRAAEEAVRAVYPRARDPEVALVAIDPRTGAVRAMVGSRDFSRRQLNIASQARRQPGSAFKPFVLAAAVDEGHSLDEVYPAPAEATFPTDSGPWRVRNYDLRDHGSLTIRRATELSVNTVYARLILDVGPPDVTRTAHRLGIGSDLLAVPSLTLGTSDVTPLEMASAYASLAARGVHRVPWLIERVTGKRGRVLYEREGDPTDAIDRDVADTVNDALQGVISKGTGARAALGRPVAGKTGTTERNVDAWFAGYTPDLAAVVWNGFPEGRRSLRGVASDAGCVGYFGGSCPAEIWRRFMVVALEGVPPTAFEEAEPRPTQTATPSPTDEGTPTPEPTEPTETASPIPEPTKTKRKPEPSESPSPKESPSPSPSE